MTSAHSGSDLEPLERELLGAIAGAADLAALEQVRVAALGKKGRVAELMADARRAAAGGAQGLRPVGQRRQGSASARRSKRARRRSKATRSSQRLASERADVTLPVRLGPEAPRPHPSRQPGLSTSASRSSPTWASPSPKVRTSRRTRSTSTSSTFRPSIRRARSTTRSISRPRRDGARAAAAHAHEPGADPHHAERRSRRSASSRRAASIAATATRRTRRCSIRSRASSSTRRPTWGT